MRKFSIDTCLRVRLQHKPGQLARLVAAIADRGSLIGDISTVTIGETDTVRDVVIETSDPAHTQAVIAAVRTLPDIELLEVVDRVVERHRGGKIAMKSRVEVRGVVDLRYVYTPGVARISTAIAERPELAWELTSLGRSVGIFTNGTRVLGLGDIGPVASLPVMEGKAVLYDRLAGISAVPMLVDTKDPSEFIETVLRMSKSFGGIHLEDIRVPDCFAIERELKARLDKPVMHDDQHGTATAALAAILVACRMTGHDPRASRIGQIGLGAAGSAIARLAMSFGAREVLVTDVSPGAVTTLASEGARGVDLATLLRESDIVVATTGRPNLIRPEDVRAGQVIFALSNPAPEIQPDDARSAGAAFAADGRSINNALAYPGLFRGALQARSRAITPEMLIAAAHAIADLAPRGQLVPDPLDPRVHEAVTASTMRVAAELGLTNTATL